MIRPTNPKTSNGHHFSLVVINYFTKWVRAASYANMTQRVIKKFIDRDIIYQYGLLEIIITNNA